ncbi:MAG: anthranilate synthase component I [Eubacteriales bacterium]
MNFYPSLEEAQKYTDYQQLPLSLSVPLDKSPMALCRILKNVSNNVFVLESCEDSSHWGRYSFLGYDPILELTCQDHTVTIKQGMTFTHENTNPHKFIRDLMAQHRSPRLSKLPTFTGGLVGYFAYEFMKYPEPRLDLPSTDEEGFQDVDLMLFDKVIALDHLEQKMILMVQIPTEHLETNYNKGMETLKAMETLLKTGMEKEEKAGKLLAPLTPAFGETEFCDMVKTAQRHIIEGDIFQVVLSNRLSAPYEGSMFPVYENLRRINPSPYLFYFSSQEVEIAGASPETLVKVEEGKVTTFPLAGTKPRGKTEEEDLALEKELLADEKERAEHNMLVDLGRNDVGKVSRYGSVFVEKYMNIERFSHVMHIGSTVCGTLKEDCDYLDALDAILPAGTLSGAPKIRACEIIHDLENLKRGIYGGAIGYIDYTGNMDTCIAIRLAFKKNNKVFVRSGAGIVADSVPESEYKECIHKAKAVVKAMEVAEE